MVKLRRTMAFKFCIWFFYLVIALFDIDFFHGERISFVGALELYIVMASGTLTYLMVSAMYRICTQQALKGQVNKSYFWQTFAGAVLLGLLWIVWPLFAAAEFVFDGLIEAKEVDERLQERL